MFGNFLNPGIYKSNMPRRIALIATIGALIELLRKGYTGVEIARICDISLNTITKIKKLNNINL